MNSNNTDEIIDTEYEDVFAREINGDPLFYTTAQCAKMVGVEDSTIRYWSKRFESLLDVEVSNKNKQYKMSDVDKLIFIKGLAKEDGMTLKQIENYVSKKGFDLEKIKSSVIDGNNPLAVQTFTRAVMTEINEQMNIIAENLLKKVTDANNNSDIRQQELNEKLREDIIMTVDEVVSDRLDTKLNELKSIIDTKEMEGQKRDTEILDLLKKRGEDRKKENEAKGKKGFFKRIFNK